MSIQPTNSSYSSNPVNKLNPNNPLPGSTQTSHKHGHHHHAKKTDSVELGQSNVQNTQGYSPQDSQINPLLQIIDTVKHSLPSSTDVSGPDPTTSSSSSDASPVSKIIQDVKAILTTQSNPEAAQPSDPSDNDPMHNLIQDIRAALDAQHSQGAQNTETDPMTKLIQEIQAEMDAQNSSKVSETSSSSSSSSSTNS
ncbi:hypothetical protein A8709_14950 [Paenibacillus pectinilyticus]|uniref:Uncharacterized protein n=1 Tax=Paenibacillus pectinilyticus TaxID=512399 RepID=A0A1C1A497_9BACL|nr:hypothetical protein [Paenibacillus pectinilyticus]OCT15379.1 hypothetical protein A8709_14950 [Paenibacillus pectinilyticus]